MHHLRLVATTLTIAVAPSALGAQRFAVAGIDDDSTAVAFFRELQAAVQQDNHAGVAALVSYPLAVNDSGGTTTITDRREFIAHYSDIITPNVRWAVIVQDPDSLFANWQGVMIGRGHVWFNVICELDTGQACLRLAITAINRDAPSVPRSALPNKPMKLAARVFKGRSWCLCAKHHS